MLKRVTFCLFAAAVLSLHYGLLNTTQLLEIKKAGDGNRTHLSSLEGWCSTNELHLQDKLALQLNEQVGVTGFEPAASWSQTRRSSQTEPHPVTYLVELISAATQVLLYITFSNLVNTLFKKIFTRSIMNIISHLFPVLNHIAENLCC